MHEPRVQCMARSAGFSRRTPTPDGDRMSEQSKYTDSTGRGDPSSAGSDLEVSLARRRMLRTAAAATPVIFTLHSGSARALASGLVDQAHSLDQAVVDDNGVPRCFEAVPNGDAFELTGVEFEFGEDGCQGGILVAASSFGSIPV